MLVSVCIPVFNGEKFLRRCLDSVAAQTFTDFEIIVVDDCSCGRDENGFDCRKICKVFTKQTKIKVNYVRHGKNLGCIESRRTAILASRGKYIFCLDCDDSIKPDALEVLVRKALECDFDIVQGGTEVYFVNPDSEKSRDSLAEQKNLENVRHKANLLLEEPVFGSKIFNAAIIDHSINLFVWGRLIKKSLFLQAFEKIPNVFCVFGEDYLISFFVSYFAKSYAGIITPLYVYSVDTGISSSVRIETIERWEKICSVSSVFSIIFDEINNGELFLDQNQSQAVHRQCNTYVLNCFRYLKYFVAEPVKKQAFSLMCEYWGKGYIEKILNASGESLPAF